MTLTTATLPGSAAFSGGTQTRVFKNFINGEWVESSTGETFENVNPADRRDLVGIFQKSGKADVDAAVEAAQHAFHHWRLVPAPRRAEIIYRAAEMLQQRKEDYARDMTREMGKVLNETRGDVQEAVDTAYYMAGEGRRMFGPTTPSELPNKFAMAVRQPIGVCGMIAPWNFPMAIPSWKLLPALVCGNTCVIKPAQDTPLSTFNLVRELSEAGVPSHQHRYRFWADYRSAFAGEPSSSRHFFHRLFGGGTHRGNHCGADFQALLARTGRQESHDCAG
jgi:aldehyde dehydrogenase (NAD+)